MKAAAAFPKEKPPPLPSHLSFTPFHIFISLIHLSILLHPRHVSSGALFLSPLSFLSTPPSSLRTPDTAHVQPFVWRCPFITGLNSKEIHIWSRSPFDDYSACVQMCMDVWMHLIKFASSFFHMCLYLCVLGCWVY